MTRMHAGFTGVVQDEWPMPRGWAPPERVAALAVDTLPGVGAALAKRLRALGIATVRDLLLHRPRRYERAVDEIAISQLWGDDEVAIAGEVVDVRTRRLGGRRTIVTARVKDASGTIGASWFNQPWLADKLTPGTHLRLRGKLGRYGFDVKSYDVGAARATADFAPVYPASEQVPSTQSARARRARRSPRHGRYPARRAARRSSSCRCAATRSPRCTSRRPRPRRRRRAGGSRSTSCSRCSSSSHARATTTPSRARCLAGRRARRPLPRRAPVRAHRAPGARDRGDRPRPRAHDADAAAAAGRRRLGQDGRRALRAAACGREPGGRAR